jgi:hypothetical protein
MQEILGIPLDDGERLIFKNVGKMTFREQQVLDKRSATRNTALLILFIVIMVPLSLWMVPVQMVPSGLYLSKWFPLLFLSVAVVAIYLLKTANQIARLVSKFYRSFSPDELGSNTSGLAITDRRLILKGYDQFQKPVSGLPADLVSKKRDTIIVKREALESIENEARFYTFKIKFRLKDTVRVGGQNIHAARYTADQMNEMLPKLIEFGKASSPDVQFKHVESPDGDIVGLISCGIPLILLSIIAALIVL